MKIKSLIRIGAALSAAILLSSCFEITNNIALNPDGSGKFVYTTTMPAMPMNLNFGGADQKAPDTASIAKEAAKKLVTESQGVDVWEKLDFKVTDDGKMTITGAGYFKDITKLKIGGGEGPSFGGDDITFKKTDDGKLLLEMAMDMGDKKPAADDSAEKPKLSDEEVTEKIKQGRAQWAQMKGMMAGTVGSMKMDMNVKMPGKIVSSQNFKQKGDDVGTLSFTGKGMIDMMDKIITDDALAKKVVSEGGELMGEGAPPIESDEMNKLLFGEKGGLQIISEVGEPQFDYAEHSAAAKANQSAELKALLPK